MSSDTLDQVVPPATTFEALAAEQAEAPRTGRAPGRVRGRRPQRPLRRSPGRARRDHVGPPSRDHRLHRTVGLRQDDRPALLQPDERPDPQRTGGGQARLSRHRPLRPARSTRSRFAVGSAWCSRSRTRSRSRSTTTSPTARASAGIRKKARSSTRSSSDPLAPGRAVGRGQGPAQEVGARHVGWSAAAAVHRPGRRRRSRGDPHGRAVLGARSHRHGPDRGPDDRDQVGVHDRDRHPQHAAGRPRVGRDRVLLDRGQPRERRCGPASWSRSTPPPTMFSNPSDERTENYITGRFG